MIRRLIYLLGFLLITSLCGCHSYVEVVKFRSYKAKDYINIDVAVYELDEQLYPILDSIIVKAEECPQYQGLKTKIAFSFSFYEKTREDSLTSELCVSAVYSPRFFNYAQWTKGVFYYKNYDFYINNDVLFLDTLMRKTNRIVSIKCIDPEKYELGMHYRGDKDMYWWYKYENDQFTNLQYGYCYEPD